MIDHAHFNPNVVVTPRVSEQLSCLWSLHVCVVACCHTAMINMLSV